MSGGSNPEYDRYVRGVMGPYLDSLPCRHFLLKIMNHASDVGKHEQRYDDKHDWDSDFPEAKYAGMHDQQMLHIYTKTDIQQVRMLLR